MFKKLRLRLLLMNLALISLLMVGAFSSIYWLTYNHTQQNIHKELVRMTDVRRAFLLPRLIGPPDVATDRTISFVIQVDVAYRPQIVSSYFEAKDGFYDTALSNALGHGKDFGRFELDGSTWAFKIQQRGPGYLIAFMDVSGQMAMLSRLFYVFFLVTLVMLFLILGVSTYMTSRSLKPVQEAFKRQSQFISDASHEIKTPLTVISTNVDVLLSETQATDQQKWLHYIQNEVDRLSRLTHHLLMLAQVEDASLIETGKEIFNISERFEQHLLAVESTVFETGKTFTYRVEPNIMATGNPEQLEQVLLILLDNAIKYASDSGKIDLSLNTQGSYLLLKIFNTGEGISPEDMPFVFDRFYRGDKARTGSGSHYGLGLSIAKAIVDRHDGKISCECPPTGGVTFTVKLKV